MNEAGCPCGPIYNIGEAFEDPHVKSLKMTRTAHHETLGDINLIRSPINLSAFEPGETFEGPGPELGQHTDEILIDLGMTENEIESLRAAGAI